MRYIIEGQKKSAYFDNSKPWYLLGIVSYGTKICGAGSPAVYTRCMICNGKDLYMAPVPLVRLCQLVDVME